MNNKYKIIIEKYAQEDLENIYNYIKDDLVNTDAAVKLLNKFIDKFETISMFPDSSPLLDNEYISNKNIRKLLVDKYIAFYEVDHSNKEVKIIRILYGMMNYIDILWFFILIFVFLKKDIISFNCYNYTGKVGENQ